MLRAWANVCLSFAGLECFALRASPNPSTQT
jgi:hypothetical protein